MQHPHGAPREARASSVATAARGLPTVLHVRSQPPRGPMFDGDRVLDSMSRKSPRQVVIYGDLACPWS
jgi:hypothetical protein